MKDFTEMNLSLVSVGEFDPAGLYCLDDSPLQNQTFFPGCYGICANPDVSGIGNRLSLYIQTILTLWLATLTPHPDDTLGAMLAAIAASWTIFVATLAQYAYNNITFHHTLITINLSNLPTVAFFAGILRLRLQPGVIPLGPKLFATPILILQFIACAVSVLLGIGLNSIIGSISKDTNTGRGGLGSWEVAQPQCNNETQVVVFGRSLQFWQSESVGSLSNITPAERNVILAVYGVLVFLPFFCSFVCLYLPETGTLRVFATAFHQEKRTNKFALFVFFVLSNAWTGLLIYATEIQIMRNNVLPGENQWGSGQILAMFLVLIPLLGCIKIFIKEVGDRNRWARTLFKRTKLHRVFGVQFEPHNAGPHHAEPSEPNTPKDDSETKDIEAGVKSSDQTSSPPTPRRLSKLGRFEVPNPGENVIVSPGDDSEPEKDDKFAGRPSLADTRQNTLVNSGKWTEVVNRDSIASQSVRSFSGNVKVIVNPDGRMSRVLSRGPSYAAGNQSDRERDDEDKQSSTSRRRRLSKHGQESVAGSTGIATPRRSHSQDGVHPAAENASRHTSRPSSIREGKRRSGDVATIQNRSAGHESVGKDTNDDPLSKYYWDPQRGWLEKN